MIDAISMLGYTFIVIVVLAIIILVGDNFDE